MLAEMGGQDKVMTRAADRTAADEEQASVSSSEPLLGPDTTSHWARAHDGNGKSSRRNFSSTSGDPRWFRWMATRRTFDHDEKMMRRQRRRCRARLGVGTLIFL